MHTMEPSLKNLSKKFVHTPKSISGLCVNKALCTRATTMFSLLMIRTDRQKELEMDFLKVWKGVWVLVWKIKQEYFMQYHSASLIK